MSAKTTLTGNEVDGYVITRTSDGHRVEVRDVGRCLCYCVGDARYDVRRDNPNSLGKLVRSLRHRIARGENY